MRKITRQDYDNCILGITSSILQHYGVSSSYSSSSILDKALLKKYRNVVLMIFDGMGVDMLRHNLGNGSFLLDNMRQQLTSVYPCTTTAAMTAYYSGLSPIEHGWLGWSLYFKEFNCCLDTFTNQDSFTKVNAGELHAAYSLMPYKTVYEMIDEASSSQVKSYTIVPTGIIFPDNPNIKIEVNNVEQICDNIKRLSSNGEQKFIMSYWYNPDSTMHKEGCYSDKVKTAVEEINDFVSAMCEELDDSLVILSADHGLINVTDEVYLNEIPELDDCLILPPTIETRAASLFIKPELINVFKQRFEKLLGNDFLLISKDEIINGGMLGKGSPHKKVSDFIGDYVACATGSKILRYKTFNSIDNYSYKGQHAGLTEEEMLVPLIIIEKP